MTKQPLDGLFESLMAAPQIFKERDTLRHTYVPDELPHREEEIERLGNILFPVLSGSTPSNLFLYGKTGTGKTAVTKYVLNFLLDKIKEISTKSDYTLATSFMNCQMVNTNYRVVAYLCDAVGEKVPFTGLPTDEVYSRFKSTLDSGKKLMIIVLDEVDILVKKSGDETLYNLTRINTDLENSKVCLIGISNDLKFKEYLDPRVLSSLSEEEIVFPPYTAIELIDILKQRAELGFQTNSLEEGVINLCAALAAQEHGDARKALDLLRVAGEIAARKRDEKVTEENVREAAISIERDTVAEALRTLPLHPKLILYSVYLLEKHRGSEDSITGDVFNVYSELCSVINIDPLTQRRIGDFINELDMLGLINAQNISLGRYGRTKRIKLSIPKKQIQDNLEGDERIGRLSGHVPENI